MDLYGHKGSVEYLDVANKNTLLLLDICNIFFRFTKDKTHIMDEEQDFLLARIEAMSKMISDQQNLINELLQKLANRHGRDN